MRDVILGTDVAVIQGIQGSVPVIHLHRSLHRNKRVIQGSVPVIHLHRSLHRNNRVIQWNDPVIYFYRSLHRITESSSGINQSSASTGAYTDM